MQSAINAFLLTLAITSGILAPFILLTVFTFLNRLMLSVGQALLNKAEEIKKMPPFDEVEVNVSPSTRVMTARFQKRGVIIWQGSASQNEDGGLDFKTEEIQ